MRETHQLPRCLSSLELISGGATGLVLKVEDGIALKYASKSKQQFLKENSAYTLFEQQPSLCPYILQSFVRVPDANFMALASESLGDRLRDNTAIESTDKIQQWAVELTGAIAWLESLGYVHGDLRPNNVLLDAEGHIKLADFDSYATIGSPDPGNGAPWARIVGKECPTEIPGSFGSYGARTEQFAFGSILYNITHGCELYHDMGPEIIDHLRDLRFPELEKSVLNDLTVKCWHDGFESLAELHETVVGLFGNDKVAQAPLDAEYVLEKQQRCRELLNGEFSSLVSEDIHEINNSSKDCES